MVKKYGLYSKGDIEVEEPKYEEIFIIWPETSGIGIEINKNDIIFGNKITITPEIKVYPINNMVRISKTNQTERYWLTKENIKTILDMEV